MSAASYLPPAPFESRSHVILDKKVLTTTLTACSGRSTRNVPGVFQPRWGESLHPDLDPNLRWGESLHPDLDPGGVATPRFRPRSKNRGFGSLGTGVLTPNPGIFKV